MASVFLNWQCSETKAPKSFDDLRSIILKNRSFTPVEKLVYGDHGLMDAKSAILRAIKKGRRIALYADYDVDGTMSCVSWVWFLNAIGYSNFVHYIPCRQTEGYGLNMGAVKELIDIEGAQLIITMDTGITAKEEAEYCKQRGVDFICTDHHEVQPDKIPDCIVLSPKFHPDTDYQDLCGCGITFVLIRKLAESFNVPESLWTDLLAITGMATICDLVTLGPVNHRLAQLGVQALTRSSRPVIRGLIDACGVKEKMNEQDVGFLLGPRINAVGRLGHANTVIEAFTGGSDSDDLVEMMGRVNDKRKSLQKKIISEACELAHKHASDPILFLGGDWHPGVAGIAASRVAQMHWKPTWLFQRNSMCKGSARSIPGFDVTGAMQQSGRLFSKFGGHTQAAGYSFSEDNESAIRSALCGIANKKRRENPEMWTSKISYDCELPANLLNTGLIDVLDAHRPYGRGFEEPRFLVGGRVARVDHYNDKATGLPAHTAISVDVGGTRHRVMLFNNVVSARAGELAHFIVSASRDTYKGIDRLSLIARDCCIG